MNGNTVDSLLEAILKIPGSKIVTVVGMDFKKPVVMDITVTGKFGYHHGHKSMFVAALTSAMQTSGGITIREMLDSKVMVTVSSGERMMIPRKRLYGIVITGGKWRSASADEVKWAHIHDNKTGKVLAEEPEAFYTSLDDVLLNDKVS